MRSNQPITDREYVLHDDDLIVSRTDDQGRITYVNPTFIEVSGFELDELIGQPHNIVRHSDMPAQAFEDLWRNLKAGRPWTGLVKNRCKNGDFYWVRANVTPLRQQGRIVGYFSVRTKPDRSEVDRVRSLYAALQRGGRGAIRDGEFIGNGISAVMNLMLSVPAGKRMAAHTAIAASLLVGSALATPLAAPSWLQIGLPLIGLAWLVAGWVWMNQTWLKPLRAAREGSERAASGELGSAPVVASADPEIGQVMRATAQMTANLRAVIGDVQLRVKDVDRAVGLIASGNADLSDRTQSQAAALEQSSASLEQISATVRESADNAKTASESTHEATRRVVSGGEAVRRVVDTMRAIEESSSRIRSIVTVIDGIAFQTNILALNAAVEAARAGEQGRGFAVVAAEVRGLAQRAGSAAGEIRGLIEESLSRVQEGDQAVAEAHQTIASVEEQVLRMSELVDQITRSAQQQNIGLAQISDAVAALDKVTQDNASLVDSTVDHARGLQVHCSGLLDAVAPFRAR